MRKIDVAAWIKGANVPHAASVNEVSKHVAEYAEDVKEEAFKFSPIDFVRRQKQVDPIKLAELAKKAGIPPEKMIDFTNAGVAKITDADSGRVFHELNRYAVRQGYTTLFELIHKTVIGNLASPLVSACERLDPGNKLPAGRKGLILALDDPTGVITDLAALMPLLTDQFLLVNKFSRKLATSRGIASLRQAVINQRSKVIAKEVELAAIGLRLEGADPEGHLGDGLRNYVDVTAEAERIWETFYARYDSGHKKGQPRYDEAALAAFRQEYDAALAKFDADVILPLSMAHAAWMGSDTFLVNLETNYDTADILSGEAYTTVVSVCIADTQDKTPCSQLYEHWLEDEGDNPLKRAIGFNQDNVLAALAERVTAEPLIIKVEEMEKEEDAPGKRPPRSTDPVIKGHANTDPTYEKGRFLKALSGYSSKPFSAWETLHDAQGRLLADKVSKDRVGLLMTQVLAPITRCVSKWAAKTVQKLAPGVGRACAMADGVIFGVEFNTTLGNQVTDIRIGMTNGFGDENETYRDKMRRNENIIREIDRELRKMEKPALLKAKVMTRNLKFVERAQLNELAEEYAAKGETASKAVKAKAIELAIEEVMMDPNDPRIQRRGVEALQRRFSGGAPAGLIGAAIVCAFSVAGLFAANAAVEEEITRYGKASTEKNAKDIAAMLGLVAGVTGVMYRSMNTAFYRMLAVKGNEALGQLGKTLPDKLTKGLLAMDLSKGISNFTGKAAGLALKVRLPFAQGMSKLWEKIIFEAGVVKGLGLAGALIGAYWDGVHTLETAAKEQYGMAVLYGASALAGGVLAASLFALILKDIGLITSVGVLGSTGLGLALLAIMAILAVGIAIFKDDDVQIWLGRCLFGNDEEKYNDDVDGTIEANELRRIMGLEPEAA
jgi:hypothetical protein